MSNLKEHNHIGPAAVAELLIPCLF